MGDEIYGGTQYAGHLFVFDPATESSTDLGQALPTMVEIRALTSYGGKVFGGTAGTGQLFVFDPATGVTTDLGIPVAGDYNINALVAGTDGRIYGGTGGGHLFVYDPVSGGTTDLGTDAPGWGIYALAVATDGNIYGGAAGGYLFEYEPSSDTFTDLGQPVPDESMIRSFVFGLGGKLYGGTGDQSGQFFVFDPSTASVTNKGRAVFGSDRVNGLVIASNGFVFGGGSQLFSLDPADQRYNSPGIAISNDIIPGMRSLGNVAATDYVIALTKGSNGLIYGGGAPGAQFFAYNPTSDEIFNLGTAVYGESSVQALTTGLDGRIYGGTGPNGHLFIYDPSNGNITDLGQAVVNNPYISALTAGIDGRIYGGTFGSNESGRLFVFDLATGTIADKGKAVANEYSIGALTTAPDGRIFGGTSGNGHLFVYDPANGVVTDKGKPVPGEYAVKALTVGRDGQIYGGTGHGGHVFVYDPQTDAARDLGIQVQGWDISALAASGERIFGAGSRIGPPPQRGMLFYYEIDDAVTRIVGNPVVNANSFRSLAARDDGVIYGGGYGSGLLFSYDPQYTFEWQWVDFDADSPAGTSIQVDVLNPVDEVLLSDCDKHDSLALINSKHHPGIKLRAVMSTDVWAITPQLAEWSVTWPEFQAKPNQLTFWLGPGEPDTASTTVQIMGMGDESVTWTASIDQGWLSCSPVTGTVPAVMMIDVDKSGLSDGWHRGAVDLDWSITGGEQISGTEVIAVSLLVGEYWETHLPLIIRDH